MVQKQKTQEKEEEERSAHCYEHLQNTTKETGGETMNILPSVVMVMMEVEKEEKEEASRIR